MMKKLLSLLLVCWLICFAWCNSSSTSDTTTPKYEVPKKSVNYSWVYISAWVWPDASWEYSVEDNELVLRWWSRDVVIHLRVPEDIYTKFFDSETDYTPWNQIELDGNFIEMPSKFRNRVFEAKDMKSMEVVSYPNVDELKSIFDLYSACNEDSDCDLIWWISPLECVMWINKDLKETWLKVLYWYKERLWDNIEEYEYKCPAPKGVTCQYNVCMPLFWVEWEVFERYEDWEELEEELEDYSQDYEWIKLDYDELF